MYLSSSYDSKKSTDSTDDSNNAGSLSSSGFRRGSKSKFTFPPAPRLCKSANNTSCSVSCQSDSSASDGQIIKSKKRNRRRNTKLPPPIGVFWDIENCQVPKNKSAAIIVQRIRTSFFEGYREAEFIVVCDVKKENPQVIQDLHDAQVNLIHVQSTSKNAADEKLRQSLRRFAETYRTPATVVLISGDVNFAADLSDLRYRKKLHVILVHNSNVADALILCANETYTYASITDNLPLVKNKMTPEPVDLYVSNLPTNYDKKPLKNRLKFLSDNCGGRVTDVNNDMGTATIRFTSMDFATRAQRRLNGEDVYGRKIAVSGAGDWRSHGSPRGFGRKITKNNDSFNHSYDMPPPNYALQDGSFVNQSTCREGSWRSFMDKSQKQPTLVLQEPNTFRTARGCQPQHDQSWSHRQLGFNRPKTPQEDPSLINPLARTQKGAAEFDHSKMFFSTNNTFQPIAANTSSAPVELIITNLDSSLKDLRNILMNLLKEHAMVYNLNISSQPDGSPVALVKVGTQQDAHNIISQMHHHKLGFKRLSISYAHTNNLDSAQLKEMVITVLQEAPLNCMPLYRLLNLLEERFLTNVSVSEVNKLRDVCRITDDNGERIISLTPEVRSSPQLILQRAHILYCSVHCPNGLNGIEDLGWGDCSETDVLEIPHIRMTLKMFSAKLNALLTSHMGTLPLLSFAVCYKNEFGEPLPTDLTGVPLEHLVTCVSNVKLKYGGSNRNTKYIIRETSLKTMDGDKNESFMKSLSPSITCNINLLNRELVDLLKTTERCQLQLNKYIPAYHHHFGRQLRVADYGYTKLSDLLNSQPISNVVQILGEGSKRIITLTHATQVRRFTSDLLRTLKSQASKQLTAAEFPHAYERVLNKPFNPVEYGLCCLEDLLDEVPENTVVINRGEYVVITIPKREQTADEIMRTKQFAEEVVKLLSYSPQCSMLFNKFVPAYHHHFGHQCKVSDYGFTKLIELFEAIPDTLKVEELSDGERKISLTLSKALNLRGNQIVELIKKSHLSYLPLEALASAFQREYGFPLKPHYYECSDVNELVSKLGDYLQVAHSSAGPLLVPVESNTQSTLALRVWAILINPPHHMNLMALINAYNARYQSNISISVLEHLNNVIINHSSNLESIIFLTPPFAMAAKIYLLLHKEGGQVPYNALDSLYRRHYVVPLLQNEEDTYEKLLSDFSFLIIMRRTKKRTNIALNPKITEYGLSLPNSLGKNETQYMRRDESVSWPPPPMHDLVLDGTNRGITPPKPDTPPAPGTAPWKNWETPTKLYSSNVDFSIPLPAAQTPQFMGNTESLISPTKNLLSAYTPPLSSMISSLSPPEPNELPMPDKLLKKGMISDDSTDSGVNNSHIVSENEMDMSSEQNGMKLKYLGMKPEFLTYKLQ